MSEKSASVLLVAMAVLMAIGLGLYWGQPEGSEAMPSNPIKVQPQAMERPFWEEASVPDLVTSDAPAQVVLQPRSGPLVQRDYEAEVRALEPNGEARQLNDSLLLWFDQNPKAATDWINQTERFDDLVPSLSSLALGIANQGQMQTALAWVEAIPDEAHRHEARLRLYAQQARQRKVNDEGLKAAGFSADDIAIIRGGSLGD